MQLAATIRGVRYSFASVKEVLAKANPPKSGDDLAGVSARDAVERVAARAVLADLTLADLRANPVVPYELDEVTRIVEDDLDDQAYRAVSHLSVGQFREWLLKNYQGVIAESLKDLGHADLVLQFDCEPDARPESSAPDREPPSTTALNPKYTFESFVVGSSNQFAHAAARAVAEIPSKSYNPLFIYGGVGLGKTHLMHAVGNTIRGRSDRARVAYVHSERFVSDMVKALQHNTINDFKAAYRSLDALLIDDIQFFANKDRSQEEFFHTFNALFEGQQQIILTCDRYPKEVDGLEERLKSRFGWGLTVAIEPPELETCVAILMSKAAVTGIELPEEVAFFMAKRIRSNVRELEGALIRVTASAQIAAPPGRVWRRPPDPRSVDRQGVSW